VLLFTKFGLEKKKRVEEDNFGKVGKKLGFTVKS